MDVQGLSNYHATLLLNSPCGEIRPGHKLIIQSAVMSCEQNTEYQIQVQKLNTLLFNSPRGKIRTRHKSIIQSSVMGTSCQSKYQIHTQNTKYKYQILNTKYIVANIRPGHKPIIQLAVMGASCKSTADNIQGQRDFEISPDVGQINLKQSLHDGQINIKQTKIYQFEPASPDIEIARLMPVLKLDPLYQEIFCARSSSHAKVD